MYSKYFLYIFIVFFYLFFPSLKFLKPEIAYLAFFPSDFWGHHLFEFFEDCLFIIVQTLILFKNEVAIHTLPHSKCIRVGSMRSSLPIFAMACECYATIREPQLFKNHTYQFQFFYFT